jgi:hypothetical protein
MGVSQAIITPLDEASRSLEGWNVRVEARYASDVTSSCCETSGTGAVFDEAAAIDTSVLFGCSSSIIASAFSSSSSSESSSGSYSYPPMRFISNSALTPASTTSS